MRRNGMNGLRLEGEVEIETDIFTSLRYFEIINEI
jgi:hypothetical protein